jgi:hypothetical protein
MVDIDERQWLSVDRLGSLSPSQLRARVNRSKLKINPELVSLVPHRGRVGDLNPLVEYLKGTDGELLVPAVVRDHASGKYVVIGGERRWRAMTRIMDQPTFVVVCEVWADYLAWLIMDKTRENPSHPAKEIAVTDVVFLTETLKRYLSVSRDDHLDDVLGEYFAIPASRIGEARSIKRVMDRNNPPEIAKLVLDEWNAVARGDASPSASFQRIRKAQIKLETPGPNVAEQRKKLQRAAEVCAGLVDALGNFGEASGELTTKETGDAIEALGKGRTALERVIRSLREVRS